MTHATRRYLDPEHCDEIRAMISSGRVPEAVEAIGAAATKDEAQRLEGDVLYGIIQERLGNYRGARTWLVRALNRSRRVPARRAYVRAKLAIVQVRQGELAAAERTLQRAMERILSGGPESAQRPEVLQLLGSLAIRRGQLAVGIRIFENAIEAIGEDAGHPLLPSIQLSVALCAMERGELEASRAAFAELDGRVPPLVPWLRVHVCLAAALNAMYREAWDESVLHLDAADGFASRHYQRGTVLARQYRHDLALMQGRGREVLEDLRSMYEELNRDAVETDYGTTAARLLADALLQTGAYAQALDIAQRGARMARSSDRFEWTHCSRIAAGALKALGRADESRGLLAEVATALEVTDMVLARRRTDLAIRELFPAEAGGSAPPPAVTRPRRTTFRLRDGRTFLAPDEETVARIDVAGATRLPVLIEGETGTGKELVARLIHERGPRARKPFVVVDCTTLSESLAEAELFGVTRGAFTGAVHPRAGLFASADGGTLLLDELPELSLALQAKLLRVVQESTFRRVGEDRERRVDVRIVGATNREIERLVAEGRFKADLFYRLNGHRIQLPPLRERRALIADLAVFYAQQTGLAGIGDAALEAACRHDWPGNVRELEMRVKVAASAVGVGATLEQLDLPAEAAAPAAGARLHEQRRWGEREGLRRELERQGGNVAATARAMGISRQALYKALRRVGLSP